MGMPLLWLALFPLLAFNQDVAEDKDGNGSTNLEECLNSLAARLLQ